MPRRFIREFQDGEAIDAIFLLADRQLRANRNAALYLSTDLRDKTGVINGRMWNIQESQVAHLQPGAYVRARGKVQLYQGTLQIILTGIDRVTEQQVDPADFEEEVRADLVALRTQLASFLDSLEDVALKRLAAQFLADEPLMAAFCATPAGIKAHHAYKGGLLEHVVTLMRLADFASGLYPMVSRDLLIMGVLLHDMGKVRELSHQGTFSYTDEGQLLGHLSIGVEMLADKIRDWERETGAPFPAETQLRLKHMILSHHGAYEFGSPRLPMTPEAVALHHLDLLDAKVNEVCRAISDEPPGDSHWTLFHPRLDRKLFLGTHPGQK